MESGNQTGLLSAAAGEAFLPPADTLVGLSLLLKDKAVCHTGKLGRQGLQTLILNRGITAY